jgi:hypothetical protein
MRKAFVAALALLLTLLSGAAVACVFGTVYNLPIPFGMYASGASAALVASFVIVGYVLKARPAGPELQAVGRRDEPALLAKVPRWIIDNLAWASLLGLLLTIATGLFGTPNRLANFGMTFFWIVFALGFTYATVLLGDLYALINPWRTLCNWYERFEPDAFRGRLRYPQWLGYYPALTIYMAFIWIELFGQIRPRTLSVILLVYTGLNLTAAWLVGK